MRLMQSITLLVNVFVDEVTGFLAFVLSLRLTFMHLCVHLHATVRAHPAWGTPCSWGAGGQLPSCPPLSCMSCTPSAITWTTAWAGLEHSTVPHKEVPGHVMGDVYVGYTTAKPFPPISLPLLYLVGLSTFLLSTSLRMESLCRWFKTTKSDRR